MTPTAAAALESAARERVDYAGAGGPRPPCPGPAWDRTIAGEIQPAATARSGVQAGITGVPGGTSGEVPARVLPGARNVLAVIAWHEPDLLLVVDPASAGDPEDACAAKAACLAAGPVGLPVLARSRPGGCGGWVIELGADAAAARAIQRCAAGAHLSQSAAGTQVRRRLDLLDGRERLRWLIPPTPDSRAGVAALACQPSYAAQNGAD